MSHKKSYIDWVDNMKNRDPKHPFLRNVISARTDIIREGNDAHYTSGAQHEGGPLVKLSGAISGYYDTDLIADRISNDQELLEALSVSYLMMVDREEAKKKEKK